MWGPKLPCTPGKTLRSSPTTLRRHLIFPAAASVLLSTCDFRTVPPEWRESFGAGVLQPGRWAVTRDGDFREHIVDVANVGKDGPEDFRLRVLADTRGTRDDTVKFLGARMLEPIRLSEPKRIAVDLDWNDQENGSYLSAAIVLSPHETSGNPLASADWLKVEYVGVPPGKNARMVVAFTANGRSRMPYAEEWPNTNREGRQIALQHVEMVARGGSFQVWENGKLLYDANDKALPFDNAYLYLQMSSHSNYPKREIYFDNVVITAAN